MSTPTSSPGRWQVGQGKFEGGVWFCACDPPLPAVFLQVKRESENKGKWFYTCPKSREKQCRFFMFEDRAKALEQKALEKALEQRAPPFNTSFGTSHNGVTSDNPGPSSSTGPINNPGAQNGLGAGSNPGPRTVNEQVSRDETPQSEVAPTVTGEPLYSPRSSVFPTPAPRQRIFHGVPRASWGSDDDSDATETTFGRRQSRHDRNPGPSTPTSKRKRPAAGDGATGRGVTADMSDLDSDDARQLNEMTDQAERRYQPQQLQQSQQSQPSSQRSQFSNNAPTTPNGRGTRAGFGGLPTPESGNSFVGASGPGAKRFKNAQGLPATSTPTPARARDAFGGGLSQGDCCSEDDADITIAVLGLLKAEAVSTTVRRAVRETLNLHALKARGVERARDMLREGLKSKDRQLAELQERVAKLESERRTRRDALKKAASELEALYRDQQRGGEE